MVSYSDFIQKAIDKMGYLACYDVLRSSIDNRVRRRIGLEELKEPPKKTILRNRLEELGVDRSHIIKIMDYEGSKDGLYDLFNEATENNTLAETCSLYSIMDGGVDYGKIVSISDFIKTMLYLESEKMQLLDILTMTCKRCEGYGFKNEWLRWGGGVCFDCCGVGSLWHDGRSILEEHDRQGLKAQIIRNPGRAFYGFEGSRGFSVFAFDRSGVKNSIYSFMDSLGERMSEHYEHKINYMLKEIGGDFALDCGVLIAELKDRYADLPWAGGWRFSRSPFMAYMMQEKLVRFERSEPFKGVLDGNGELKILV